MDNYPKIYSVSTVGVRQHENADYLLHPVRTDFTGNNGLGKSIIADLLQLIFVPLRDEWKPGTEGLDKDKRKIESIPLEKDWIQHAYSFLNIEKSKGKYITIGVFIPNTSRVPVRPFIIQQGDDFETKGSRLKSFEQILVSNDFIADTGHVLDLKGLKRNLYDKYKIHLKDFFNRDEVNNYFDLLFKNQIIPIDLTKEINLKSFAKVLQSFSRAKTLDINKSKSLQDFLFEDNEDIKTTFEIQKETLNQHIRNFHNANTEITTLRQKQSKLENLKQTFATYEAAKQDYLSKNAHLLHKIFNENRKAYEANEHKKNKAFEDYTKSKAEYENQCVESYSKIIEQKGICNQIRITLEEQQADAGKHNIENLRKNSRLTANLVEQLETLNSIIIECVSINQVELIFAKEEKLKQQKSKLDRLKQMPSFSEFKNSRWAENYSLAYSHYSDRSQIIASSLKTLKRILDLYDGNNPDSFFNWAIKHNKELSLEQETVVMSFKEIYIKKVSSNEGKKFTLKPEILLDSFDKEVNGIWVNLGELSEYFPLVSKQIFNDKDRLRQAIEKDKENTIEEIRLLEREQDAIQELNQGLINIGYNQEYCEIYHNAKVLEEWEYDKLFSEDNLNFIIEHFESFAKVDSIKEELKSLDEKIYKIIGDVTLLDVELKYNNEVLTEIFTKVNDLKAEITKPIEVQEFNIKHLELQELIRKRDENKKEIATIEKVRGYTKGERNNQKNTFDLCSQNTQLLRTAKSNSEHLFNEAKKNLEERTELKFDNLLALGHVTEELVDNLRNEHERIQSLYQTEYIAVAGNFEDSKPDNKNPEIYKIDGVPYFSFQSLVNLLCGKIGLENLTTKLAELNDNLKSLGELQLKILIEVFSLVEKQYREHEDTIRRLNFFFEKNKISDSFRFNVEFNSRKDINIDWIEKMKDKARVQKLGPDLFTLNEDIPSEENTPIQLISKIANTFYNSINADPYQLLNPKFYFTLKVEMKDEDGKSNSGSGGQAYTALALLCIGRLSIVQKQQDKHLGVKFIIIEELSNIDDTNFNIFPEIAKRFGYQLMTMTPKPFGSYTDEEWYLHMLIKGKQDKFRNYTPMSFFKTKSKNIELEKYLIKQDELEGS
ncbi:hypothetical protein ACFOW1_15890 [Parasediminibacterium paludis]|uniref:MukB N-terminal domain-containing protein n=1 Tax=Parasediminibacterium paludis TaxID=908966 RepID=A0ABV8PZG9_9BACT